ncbi:hypothetical protein GS597_13945 [Synechococcales cyanobacterium C]|uniref:Peptidase M12B domain-containing protein n=1 Tax=Petrachloros mirabilis ULC683 TaxID=2781853 RepID=A0A8K1ZYE9_9CYAN|nr:M12 family metallo-peptidase [Petrachloros mirabilis]NCJ07590.1 hypothetical protein [Petrachloros mirabilis ULC683]
MLSLDTPQLAAVGFFIENPFHVVQVDCAVNNITFAHELGHNLGACDDRDSSGDCEGSSAFAHGYQDTENQFRTIMSYDCPVSGGCPRVNRWSNPQQRFLTRILGIPQLADNVRSLNAFVR